MAENKNEEVTAEETAAEDKQQAEETAETADKQAEAVRPKAEQPVDTADKPAASGKKRAEKVGVVFSDKMTKTVVVRVDRTVKHPMYRKYMKKRKKFMAHNEMGASEGDKVRIVETRPLSARKRWRVAEIIQKAQK